MSRDGRRAQVRFNDKRGLQWIDATDPRISRRPPEQAPFPPSEPKIVASPHTHDLADPTKLRESKDKVNDRQKTVRERIWHVSSGAMSQSEASSIRESYIEALDALFELADKFITYTTKGHPIVVIWSDMDEEELGVVADAILILATRNERVALAVRSTVEIYRHGRIVSMLGVRFYKTYMTYAEFGFEMPMGGAKGWRRQMVRQRRASQ